MMKPTNPSDYIQTWENVRKHDECVIKRICDDDKFAYYFFHEKCRPLFSKILWTIYGNNADYDELVNEMYLQLKKPNSKGETWHSLRTFDYRTTLFDWIKTVAVRHLYTPSNEVFVIPNSIIDTGMAEILFSELSKATCRKYMWYKYIDKMEDTDIEVKMEVNQSQLNQLSRSSIRQLKRIVENKYPEYLDVLFHKNDVSLVDIDGKSENNASIDNTDSLNSHIDAFKYLDMMPNERYKTVLKSLFIVGVSLDDLASEMGTPIANIYNLKSRGLDQLRDILLFHNEIDNIEKYINLISDDRNKEILTSIFITKRSYQDVCSALNITEVELKKQKKKAIMELKSIIFKK